MASVWLYNKELKNWCKKQKFGAVDADFYFNPQKPLEDPLIKTISNILNIDEKYIYTGAGISQFIQSIISYNKWKHVYIPSIEFGLYGRSCECAKKITTYIDGDTTEEFVKNVKQIDAEPDSLLCFSSPKWFTGEIFTLDQVKEITKSFKGTIFIDEAYVDFSSEPNHLLELCMKNDNLILARSFSKKFIASGLRAGYIITKTKIDGLRNTIIPPHSISTHSIKILTTLLKNEKLLNSFDKTRKYISCNRNYIYNALKGNGKYKIIYSNANFITLIFNDEADLDATFDKISDIVGVNKHTVNGKYFIKIWVKNLKLSELEVSKILSK